jgi:hypothetical protein
MLRIIPDITEVSIRQNWCSEPERRRLDLLQTVTAFRLVGGLRFGSLSYESPGFVEVIGALNPLKTVKDGITQGFVKVVGSV